MFPDPMCGSIRPPLRDMSTQFVYISTNQLFQSLRMMLTGNASPIFVWDALQEKFGLRGVEPTKQGVLVIKGKDETISARYVYVGSGISQADNSLSIVKRFLAIGTIIRRLEILISGLRTRYISNSRSPIECFDD